MRNLHLYVHHNFGKEYVKLLQEWKVSEQFYKVGGAHNFTWSVWSSHGGTNSPFGTMPLPFEHFGAIYGKYSLIGITFSLRPEKDEFQLA